MTIDVLARFLWFAQCSTCGAADQVVCNHIPGGRVRLECGHVVWEEKVEAYLVWRSGLVDAKNRAGDAWDAWQDGAYCPHYEQVEADYDAATQALADFDRAWERTAPPWERA